MKIGFTYAEDYKRAIGSYVLIKNTQIVVDSSLTYFPTSRSVKNIVDNFDARLADPVKVVPAPNNKYLLIDGLRTFQALTEVQKNKGRKQFDVMCRVYTGLTREDCARIYATHDDLRTRVPVGYKIRALAIAKDPEILDFLKVTRQSGLKIEPGAYKPQEGQIVAVWAALKAYRRLGAKHYLRMMKGIRQTWEGASWSLTTNMIGGMARFLEGHDVDMRCFRSRLKRVRYDQIQDVARTFRGMSRECAFSAALADIYEAGGVPTIEAV